MEYKMGVRVVRYKLNIIGANSKREVCALLVFFNFWIFWKTEQTPILWFSWLS